MATINIGNLAFTHKGDYDGSTAYAKNDVVYYSTNGNAYIAKQATTGNAPTNATYWNQFAQGSGGIWNAGLSLGTANQVVAVNSSANALEFQNVSSDFVKIASHTFSSAASYIDFQGCFTTTYKHYELRYTDIISTDSGVYPEVGFLKASDNSHDTGVTYYSKAMQTTNQLSSHSDGGTWAQSDSQGFRPINTWNFNGGTYCPQLGRMTFTNPNTSKFKYCTFEGTFIQNNVANNGTVGHNWGIGGLISHTLYSGLRFATNSGNYHGGTVTIFGIKG